MAGLFKVEKTFGKYFKRNLGFMGVQDPKHILRKI